MTDQAGPTSKPTMSEILFQYNQLASVLGKDTVTSFKNLSAARAALQTLENQAMETTNAVVEQVGEALDAASTIVAAAPTVAVDPKYNSSGKRGPTQGIGVFCKGLIVQGKTNTEILAEVAKVYPTAKTTANCVAYYRAKLILAAKNVAAAAAGEGQTAPTEQAAA